MQVAVRIEAVPLASFRRDNTNPGRQHALPGPLFYAGLATLAFFGYPCIVVISLSSDLDILLRYTRIVAAAVLVLNKG